MTAMTVRLSIKNVKRVFTAALFLSLAAFCAVAAHLYFRYANGLTESPRTDRERTLLTAFRAGDFDAAIERSKKRRDLPDPDPSLRNPFGQLPR